MKLTQLNQWIDGGEVIQGRWILDENHELTYRAQSGGDRETSRFRATLVAAEPGTLVIAAAQTKSRNKTVTEIVKLIGTWRANAQNNIIFEVEKASGAKDVLTFRGAWRVGEHHEIIYTWDQIALKTKRRWRQELIFKGHWDMTERQELTYSLGGDTDNTFRFRGAIQTKSLLAKRGEIRYQLGMEVFGKKKIQSVTLFGAWKWSRDFQLSFEVEYAEGRKHAIIFGGTVFLKNGAAIEVQLATRDGDSLGVELIFTKDFFDRKGRLFLRLRKTLESSSAEAGITLPW